MRVLEGNVVFKYLLTMQHMTNYKKEMEEK